MTSEKTEVCMLLCMAGRSQEAVGHRARCEKDRPAEQTGTASEEN